MKNETEQRIVFTGAHSTGKTSLARAVAPLITDQGHTVTILGGIARKLLAEGIPVNRDSTVETYVALLSTQIQLQQEASRSWHILDRFIPDQFAYAVVHGNCPAHLLELMHQTHILLSRLFPIRNVFLLVPEFEIRADGARDTDPVYQREVANALQQTLDQWQIPYKVIKGTPTSRLEQVWQYIGA